MTPRINSAPRFIALIPSVRVFFLIHTCHLSTTQKETYDEDNAQKQPGGFFVILLPYADDIRKISIKSEHHPAAAEQVVVCSEYQYFFFFPSLSIFRHHLQTTPTASKADGSFIEAAV